jgi:hypothetical protein
MNYMGYKIKFKQAKVNKIMDTKGLTLEAQKLNREIGVLEKKRNKVLTR